MARPRSSDFGSKSTMGGTKPSDTQSDLLIQTMNDWVTHRHPRRSLTFELN